MTEVIARVHSVNLDNVTCRCLAFECWCVVEISVADILCTPSCRPGISREFIRTPGQIMSLTSRLAFVSNSSVFTYTILKSALLESADNTPLLLMLMLTLVCYFLHFSEKQKQMYLLVLARDKLTQAESFSLPSEILLINRLCLLWSMQQPYLSFQYSFVSGNLMLY